jgi:hypothetical protein
MQKKINFSQKMQKTVIFCIHCIVVACSIAGCRSLGYQRFGSKSPRSLSDALPDWPGSVSDEFHFDVVKRSRQHPSLTLKTFANHKITQKSEARIIIGSPPGQRSLG